MPRLPSLRVLRRARTRGGLLATVGLAALVAVAALVAGLGRSSPDASPSVVWAVGDGADGGEAGRALGARITRSRVDRFLYLGDVYERGTLEEFRRNYAPAYGRFARVTAPTPGNHDWPLHRKGYDRYWQHLTGALPRLQYSFETGGWQIISVNSETPDDPSQRRWLEQQLTEPGDCRIAFWHRPRFSAGGEHGDDPRVAPLWEAVRGRVRIVLNGHEHNSQRLKPIDGTTEFVAGAGGHSPYAIESEDPRAAWTDDAHQAALRLDLRPTRADYAWVTPTGKELDRGTIRCNDGD